jgi:hypothetical protein
VVATEITRRVLTGLAEALPEEGRNLITRVDIKRGWGETVMVRVYSGALGGQPSELKAIFKAAIDEVLGDERHDVQVVWDYQT